MTRVQRSQKIKDGERINMSEEATQSNIYDPFEAELDYLRNLGVTEIDLDPTNPVTARFLSQQLIVKVLELKESRRNEKELRKANDERRNQIEELRVLNATLIVRDRFSWIEFPAGLLSGFGGSMLANDLSNFSAWALLIVGFVFFIIGRIAQTKKDISNSRMKGNKNA